MSEIKRITLFKIKSNFGFADFLKGNLETYDHVRDEENGFEIYIKYVNSASGEKTEEQVPWLRFLNSGFAEKKYAFRAQNRFPRAIMALKINIADENSAYYVATFGQHADTHLDKTRIVYDFGIKVGMNICDVDGLRRVQTTVHEAISRQMERQASAKSSLSVFGIDTEIEFLRTISGHVKKEYVDTVESFRGKDSIAIKLPREKNISWADMANICRKFEERYNSTDYRATEFKVYDLLRHENDPVVIAELDNALCARIANKNFSKIHLAPPEFIDTEEISFAYKEKVGPQTPPLFDDLRIEDIVGVPKRRLAKLSAKTLKNWTVYKFDTEQNATFPMWNAYQCIVAEVNLAEKTYVLANGQWREVSEELKEKVEKYLREHELLLDAPYLPEGVKIYDALRKQNREEVYNAHVAAIEPKVFLFDKGKVEIAGKRLYEICDLLHLDRHFVHVKRYSSGSASISHIFTQTKLYSHAFAADEAARQSVRDWVDASKLELNEGKDKDAFKSIIPLKKSDLREPDYTVIFCLLHTQAKFALSDLPFMAQYELMLSHRFLTEDRNFKVGVIFRSVELG